MLFLFILFTFLTTCLCIGDIHYKWYGESKAFCLGAAVLFFANGITAILVQGTFSPFLNFMTSLIALSSFLNMALMIIAVYLYPHRQ